MPYRPLIPAILASLTALGAMPHKPTGPDTIPLVLTQARIHELNMAAAGNGVYSFRTTGGDPYVFSEPVTMPYDYHRLKVVSFEILCEKGLDDVQVFYGPPRESHSSHNRHVPKSKTWTQVAVLLTTNWDRSYTRFRLDFGHRSGISLQIRNLVLRTMTPAETKREEERQAKDRADRKLARALREYLQTDFPAHLDRVEVDRRQVHIFGHSPEPAMLMEIPMYANSLESSSYIPVQRVAAGTINVVLKRLVPSKNGLRDRVYSRWILCRPDAPGVLLSHARYATDTDRMAVGHPPKMIPESIKGLGGVTYIKGMMDDLAELGVHNITQNIVLTRVIVPRPGKGTLEHRFDGKTYYVNGNTIERFDKLHAYCRDHHIVVSAIILIPRVVGGAAWRRIWVHPDACEPGIYTMANVTSQEGVDYYAAALDFLAQRYCREDGRYGRIANWIIHNEVDAGWEWTNAGNKRLETYMDLYQRSLRTAYLTVRKYDPHARVFISLTHHWTRCGPKCYAPRDMLLLLRDICRREGDFEWGVAYHPYPQDLRNPRSWNDTMVNDTFDTPLITFKNLHVIDDWMKRPDFLYHGKPRGLLFSEQGVNTPDLSPASQRLQAAGLVYFWRQVQSLSTLEAFQYHRWIDHAKEGGLLLGLRAFKPGTINTPGRRKLSWYVFQALGTNREAEVTAFADKIIGTPNPK